MKIKLFTKQTLLTSIICFTFFAISAQDEKKFQFKNKEYKVEQSVLEFLGEVTVNEYITKAPLKLMYFNFYHKNSYEILDQLPPKKGIVAIELKGMSIENFDILKTQLKPSDRNQYFKLSNKFLMVYPQNTIDNNFNSFIDSQNK